MHNIHLAPLLSSLYIVTELYASPTPKSTLMPTDKKVSEMNKGIRSNKVTSKFAAAPSKPHSSISRGNPSKKRTRRGNRSRGSIRSGNRSTGSIRSGNRSRARIHKGRPSRGSTNRGNRVEV